MFIYIYNRTLRGENKQFKIVTNDYHDMTLQANLEFEEVDEEGAHTLEYKNKFPKVYELGPYVNSRDLVGKYVLD